MDNSQTKLADYFREVAEYDRKLAEQDLDGARG